MQLSAAGKKQGHFSLVHSQGYTGNEMDSQTFVEVTGEPAEPGWACQDAGVDIRTGDAGGTGPSALPVQGNGAEHPVLAGKLIFAELSVAMDDRFPQPKGAAASVLQCSLPKEQPPSWETPLREV